MPNRRTSGGRPTAGSTGRSSGGGGGGGVTQIVAGTGTAVSPAGGTGVVTVSTPNAVLAIGTEDDTLVAGLLDPNTVILRQRIVAAWGSSVVRIYAVDGVNGDDTREGFADTGPSPSPSDYATASVQAGANALKTIAGLAKIFPRLGAGRLVEVQFAPGTYAGSPADFLNGVTGYAAPIVVRGTGTVASAGTTQFDGTTADATVVGAVTATALFAAGYNPASGITTSQMTMAKVGGGTPAWGTRPALPVGLRLRGDVATTTAALRNACRQACNSATGDTVLFQTVFPGLPVVSDVFYAEQPGVVFGAMTLNAPNTTGITFVGCRWTGAITSTSGKQTYVFCQTDSSVTYSGNDNWTVTQSYTHPVLGSLTPGGGLRCGSSATLSRGIVSALGLVCVTEVQFTSMPGNFSLGAGCAARSVIVLSTTSTGLGFTTNSAPNLGTAATVGIPYTFGTGAGGAGVLVEGSVIRMGTMQIEGAGALPGLKLSGKSSVIFTGVVGGSTGNTDVGMDLQTAAEALIIIQATTAPTVTGTAGDMRWSGQALSAWTNYQFQEGWDTAGNHIVQEVTNAEYKHSTSRSVAVGVQNSGGAITAAFTLVRNNGTNLQFVPAQADTAAHAASFYGISEAIVQNGAAGLVAAPEGNRICQFDGAPVVGAIVYLSPTTAGLATTTVPALSVTNQKLRLGVCIGNSFPGALGLVRWSPDNLATLADGLP